MKVIPIPIEQLINELRDLHVEMDFLEDSGIVIFQGPKALSKFHGEQIATRSDEIEDYLKKEQAEKTENPS